MRACDEGPRQNCRGPTARSEGEARPARGGAEGGAAGSAPPRPRGHANRCRPRPRHLRTGRWVGKTAAKEPD